MLIPQPSLAAKTAIWAALAAILTALQAHSQPASEGQPRVFDINEFRVEGVTQLSSIEVEAAVYPFLGPGRVLADVERARAALEKTYLDKGYQSVSVAIPPQTVREGVVLLKVTEARVGRLRVRGSHWFSPRDVKQLAPSVAEGRVPKFDEIAHDIVVLNQIPDRRVTPAMKVGVRPGTIDVDLIVDDTLPLHGAVELNNRHGRYTTQLRTLASLHYDNLWQLGHSVSVSYQVAPQQLKDTKVFTSSYLARFPNLHWLTLTLSYLKQNSDVSTVGGINVAGPGEIAGARATFTLPGSWGFFHIVTTGVDYKHFGQRIRLGQEEVSSNPLTTWPVSTQYTAVFTRASSETQFTVGLTFNLRSLSSSITEFDAQRFNANGNFIYYRGDVSRTQSLPLDLQLYARAQGQYSADPLPVQDEFSAGGAESVRGYLESEAVGDFGASGSVEMRSPSLGRLFGSSKDEWRFFGFFDAGWLGIHEPLPEQQKRFRLWSTGGGTRLRLFGHLDGELDVAVPFRSEGLTRKGHARFHLRLAGTF